MTDKEETLVESLEDIKEATSGSAWMFYNHYNPDLLKAMNKLLVGHNVEDVVDSLLEMEKGLCKGSCEECKKGTCATGKELGCSHNENASD